MSQPSNTFSPRRSHIDDTQVIDEHYYYEQMRPLIKDGLNYEQEKEIKQVLKRAIKVPSKKMIDLEVTFWFFKRFYFVIYLGVDKRKALKFFDAQHNHKLVQWFLNSFVSVILWTATLFVMAFVVYYFKSTIGIDLVPDQHTNEMIQHQLNQLP